MKGIYKFHNPINGKVYIGQSINLKQKEENMILNGTCIDYPE